MRGTVVTHLRHEVHPDWPRAKCVGAPLWLFVTPDDVPDPPYPPTEAMVYCNACPIRVECLAYAIAHNEVGVWGVTTEYQRRQLNRSIDRERCPGCGTNDLIYENTIELCLSCGMSWRII